MYDLTLLKGLLTLALILVGIYLISLVIKKFIEKGPANKKIINVLEHKKIDQKLSITLVRIEQEKFIVAHTSNAISLQRLE